MSLGCFASVRTPGPDSSRWTASKRSAPPLLCNSFRFFGLVFIIPGVVGPNLPAGFATFAAYGNFATGLLAMLALLAVRRRPLFWLFVVSKRELKTSSNNEWHVRTRRPTGAAY
jgi:hypothetical protein